MNQFRLTVLDGVYEALIIHSSIDRTHRLTGETDEMVLIGRDDLAVLKNYADRPCKLRLKGDSMTAGRTIFRPSRQQSFTLYTGREQEVTLGAGESMPIRCEHAQDPKTSAHGASVAG